MKRGKFSQLLLLLLMVPGSGITFANPNHHNRLEQLQ